MTSRTAVGDKPPISVEIMEDAGPYQVAGVIPGLSRPSGFLSYFLRDRGRLPQSGGLALKPGSVYQVRVSAQMANGTVYTSPVWGPNVLRTGAIVDIQFKA